MPLQLRQASRVPAAAGARGRLGVPWRRSYALTLLAASVLHMSAGTVMAGRTWSYPEPEFNLRGMHLNITARVSPRPAAAASTA